MKRTPRVFDKVTVTELTSEQLATLEKAFADAATHETGSVAHDDCPICRALGSDHESCEISLDDVALDDVPPLPVRVSAERARTRAQRRTKRRLRAKSR